MQWRRKRATGHAGRRARAAWLAGPAVLVGMIAAVLLPMGTAAPAVLTPSALVTVLRTTGTPAVGALFRVSGGKLGSHFCTASVVDSPAGDLLVTAAHCVAGYSATAPTGIAFVPGYNGKAPYGTWTVTRIFVDPSWASTADPDDDVAFLTVAQRGSSTPVEDITGSERLGIGEPSGTVVRVTGYPDTSSTPISCQTRSREFSSTQMEILCDGYTTGTSGSPFLVDVDAVTGDGTVMCVIGGYQQGGDSANVSYCAAFGQNVKALYATAVSHS